MRTHRVSVHMLPVHEVGFALALSRSSHCVYLYNIKRFIVYNKMVSTCKAFVFVRQPQRLVTAIDYKGIFIVVKKSLIIIIKSKKILDI